WPVHNAAGGVVNVMNPGHVDPVFIAGKPRKWRGQLVGVDSARAAPGAGGARRGGAPVRLQARPAGLTGAGGKRLEKPAGKLLASTRQESARARERAREPMSASNARVLGAMFAAALAAAGLAGPPAAAQTAPPPQGGAPANDS